MTRRKDFNAGYLYEQLIELNKENYPSLLDSDVIGIGWELKTSCEPELVGDKNKDELVNSPEGGGYKLSVQVKDINDQPVTKAKVTLHSEVQETFTDENGKAIFTNVEKGEHTVLVEYERFSGEETIYLNQDDVFEYDLKIQVRKKSSRLLIIILVGIVFTLLIIIFWQRRTFIKHYFI